MCARHTLWCQPILIIKSLSYNYFTGNLSLKFGHYLRVVFVSDSQAYFIENIEYCRWNGNRPILKIKINTCQTLKMSYIIYSFNCVYLFIYLLLYQLYIHLVFYSLWLLFFSPFSLFLIFFFIDLVRLNGVSWEESRHIQLSSLWLYVAIREWIC